METSSPILFNSALWSDNSFNALFPVRASILLIPDATELVKEICKRIDGGGGGQQNFASGSGNLNIDSDELKDICKKYL